MLCLQWDRCFLRQLAWLIRHPSSSKYLDWLLCASLGIRTVNSSGTEGKERSLGRHIPLYFIEPTLSVLVRHHYFRNLQEKKIAAHCTITCHWLIRPIYNFRTVKVWKIYIWESALLRSKGVSTYWPLSKGLVLHQGISQWPSTQEGTSPLHKWGK